MDQEELEKIISRAAEQGAKQALKDIGLSDEEAYDDVKELRGLLDAWRATKSTVGQTIAKMLTTSILTALAVGIWMSWGVE
jgi:2-iminoacetate synthase ThiH|tara:strand:+ start:160 stop:402 length:243 start_codon:yes stop_codon:yes gene_type:complete